ncbi:MAG: hypothetical protein AAFY31_05565 [Pseudomonadota bacterium]
MFATSLFTSVSTIAPSGMAWPENLRETEAALGLLRDALDMIADSLDNERNSQFD